MFGRYLCVDTSQLELRAELTFTIFFLWAQQARFLDSNWLMFGIEAVVVLMVCIGAAYGVGALLNYLFLPDYVVQIRREYADI